MSLSKKTIAIFIIRILSIVLAFIMNVVLGNLLGTAGYGVVSSALALYAILTIFCVVGLDQYSVKKISNMLENNTLVTPIKSHLVNSYYILIISSTIMIVIVSAVVVVAGGSFSADILFAITVAPLTALLLFYEGVFRGVKMPVIAAIPNMLVRPLVSLMFVILVYYLWDGISPAIVLYLIAAAIFVSLLFMVGQLVLRLNEYIRDRTENSDESISIIFSKSSGFFLVALATVALVKSDILILSLFMRDSEVGIYAAAYNLSFAMLLPLHVIGYVYAAEISLLFQRNDKKGLKDLLVKSQKYAALATLPLLLIFVIFPEVSMGLFGEGFKNAEFVLLVLAFGMFSNAAFGVVGNLLLMTGYTTVFLKIITISAIVQALLLYYVIPVYGILGAAIVVSLVMMVWNAIAWYCANDVIKKMNSESVVHEA